MTAQRKRWPSESAISNAIAALEKAKSELGGIRVYTDGSFEILTIDAATRREDVKPSGEIAAKIKAMAG